MLLAGFSYFVGVPNFQIPIYFQGGGADLVYFRHLSTRRRESLRESLLRCEYLKVPNKSTFTIFYYPTLKATLFSRWKLFCPLLWRKFDTQCLMSQLTADALRIWRTYWDWQNLYYLSKMSPGSLFEYFYLMLGAAETGNSTRWSTSQRNVWDAEESFYISQFRKSQVGSKHFQACTFGKYCFC